MCQRHSGGSMNDLADAIEKELEAFVEGVAYADDRTLVLARRES